VASVDVTTGNYAINWAPETEADEVVQNVAFLISTATASVPLARSIGASDAVDAPMSQAKVMLMTDIYRAISQFEPRATVTEISFDESDVLDGQLRPTVRIEI
jgi:phage baseplate assembly protein W